MSYKRFFLTLPIITILVTSVISISSCGCQKSVLTNDVSEEGKITILYQKNNFDSFGANKFWKPMMFNGKGELKEVWSYNLEPKGEDGDSSSGEDSSNNNEKGWIVFSSEKKIDDHLSQGRVVKDGIIDPANGEIVQGLIKFTNNPVPKFIIGDRHYVFDAG